VSSKPGTIEAVVLGSGTSNGIPMLGYQYPPGYLDNPKNHRTRSSFLLKGPEGNLLVDCPPEMRLQLTGQKIESIEAVLLTHTHADHVMGMDDLRSLTMRSGRSMPVYSLPQYLDDVRRIFPYAFQQFPEGVFVPRFDLRDAPDVLEVGGMTVRIFRVVHGTLPVLAVRVGDLAYITDVSEIPAEAVGLLHGLRTLVLGCIRYRPHPNHFHLEKAIEVARSLGAGRTIFTHLGHDFDHDVTNAELPAGFELSFDGMAVEVTP
jgi:phosphoribosyl 1,2-cyclic phosphate phosphodiesterase